VVAQSIRTAALLALGVCTSLLGSLGVAQASAQQPDANAGIDASRRTAIVDASARVSPAVVSVRVTRATSRPTGYDLWIGQPRGTPQSFGTGFILRSDGVVITNQHVVANGQQVTVTLADGSDVEGRVLGADPLTDIAVIKLDRQGLPVVRVGSTRGLLIGEWAIALGNPYSYLLGNSEPTVTAGVISATGRNILPVGDQAGSYLDMIQTDAAINPGNSGGPLVNALGEVIGVTSSIFSSSGGSVGLGFAIPIERAVRIADEIVRNGSVRRAYVGLTVRVGGVSGDWKQSGGVPVGTVAPDGPAARAGVRAGDVLVRANGRTLRNYLDWDAVLLDLHVGDSVGVVVNSGGRTTTLRVVTGDLPTVTADKVRVLRDIDLISITPSIRAERRIQSTWGALVYQIPPDFSQRTRLLRFDVIIGINGQALRSAEAVAQVIREMRPGQDFILNVERDGMHGTIPLRLQ